MTGTRANIRGSTAGLTLLETIVAALILAVALVGLLAALVSEVRLRRINKERALARNAAERTLSAIRGMESLVEAYQRFGGVGPEATFDVRGLADPAPGERVGRVIVWRRKGGNPPDPASTPPLSGADLQEARTRPRFPGHKQRQLGQCGGPAHPHAGDGPHPLAFPFGGDHRVLHHPCRRAMKEETR
ncbi:MAG: type IV pilus modification PilV family protein [Planctomycetota bacterium]